MNNNKKILIVDDNSFIRNILLRELGDEYDTATAENGAEALEKAVSYLPDLITMDIEMPGFSGFDVYERLNLPPCSNHFTHVPYNRIPVIFITANDNLEDRRRGFSMGAADFVTKPFAQGEIRSIIDKILKPDHTMKGLSALVVDDSRTARHLSAEIMKRQGVKVYECEDGKKAFELLSRKREEIDIVLTDFEMPGLNGKELCEKIRKNLNMTDIPVLVLTAVSDLMRLLELFKAGASDYIVKPYVREELVSRLAAHLDRASLTRNLRKTVRELRAANDEIRKLSITDPLTGCFNRRYINDQLEKELCRAKRYCHCLGIIMCDIDHFKKVNDTFGHHAGDEVLKDFVSCIRKNSRSGTDWLARYGGEEFLIILPETDLKGTTLYAERVRKSVSEMKMHCNGNEITITSSFGATAICPGTPPECSSMEHLLKHVDLLLYRSKDEGRNRVSSSPPPQKT